MRRAEKPEGYRQMRPKTFPASNNSGNSQQMLQEIRESLRNLSPSSNASKPEQSSGKGPPDESRQQGRSTNPRNSHHHRALQEIRKSLQPFAHDSSSSGDNSSADSSKHTLQTQEPGFDEELMVNRINFQEAVREQIPSARPVNTAIKQAGPPQIQQPLLRRQSWKGSKESLAPQRHSALINDVLIYRPSSPGPQSDLSRPATFPQNLASASSGQRVNAPLSRQVRSITPPPSSWDSNPSTKRYSGNLDYLVPRISPVPQGPRGDGYINPQSQNQRGLSPVPVGRQPIIMQNSNSNKFNFPPSWPQNGSMQNEYMGMNSGARQPPPPPYSMHQTNRQSPTAQQMQSSALTAPPNGASLPQSMLVPNRNSHNLDMYNLGVIRPPVQQAQTPPGQDTSSSWTHSVPGRSNSFTSAPNNRRQCPNSQLSATTVTTVTQAPILQPVKSMRVQKPELHTAVAPAHPPWLQPPPPTAYQEPPTPPAPAAEVPSYQGPPPPYPKHLLQQQQPPPGYDSSPALKPCSKEGDAADNENDTDSTCSSERAEGSEEEKKQITTSPVPVRRHKRDEERKGESRLPMYSPQAFKFFMEQHVENILKNHQQRMRRKKQLESEMQRVGLSGDAQEQMRMMLSQKESNYIRLKRAKMDKCMFEKIKTLGIGAFGEVCLARKVDTGALYAMKTLRKKDVLLRNQVAHVKAERDILAEADNEWVVRLYYSFQDKDNLYFVMDYIPGGDMMSLLIRMGIFQEDLAQFYIAELICAVESVHKMGFIHRDIKPDNILIDRDGHIKLTDFGLCTGFRWTHDSKYYQSGDHVRQDSMDFSMEWEDSANCRCGDRLKPLERRAARQHQRCLAHSLVGTPNYIAPEVLLRTGYTQLCDWWSVGVILYEMVVGQPPFLATTPLETQMKVIRWQTSLHIPLQAKLSPEATDLILKLCRGPDDRLGRNGADEIKAQPFFRTIDFSKDLRQQHQAPYIPKITHSTDTSNFDPVDPDKLWSEDADGNHNDTLTRWFKNGKHPEHAFYEFTFRRFFDDNGHPYSCPKPIESEEEDEDEDYVEEDEPSQRPMEQSRDLVYV
uniref:non-specific serine/threonine protein kinase n=1 Tax=Danio rerio TaxID=7955 RepID=Q5RIL6_DANRE|nr:serine/threonine-protein kinase LATS1 isoform X1 [Danio rerio]AAI71344.1 LATS, large tumor suppressor, homolog 1 (Drosophila) [Danio rerio]|eukprot:XP_005160369.1 serine/threonine-protein kinase LATS1 isoform X1 [Danio rerio]